MRAREITNDYLTEIWNKKIEKKIMKEAKKGESDLVVRMFHSHYSSEMLAKVGRNYGYHVEVLRHEFPDIKFRILIKW